MKKQKFAIGAVLFWCVLAVSGTAWCGDNGNGTVTVNGLVWLKDAGCMGKMYWANAMPRSSRLAHGQCGLSDNSKIGDWRLPTIDELKAVYAYKGQFQAVKADLYWSSSRYVGTLYFWGVVMDVGNVVGGNMYSHYYVWPVRAVQ